ncbi:MAG: protein kinase [Verrucomicrobia subdivision 3 bacterium]|nr:protein kinase [Limisphaerales bacterium]
MTDSLEPNQPTIPEHTLLRCIASGSYGDVWLARNATGTWRAVKIVRRDRFEHDRPFEREYEGIQSFEPVSREHPGLVNVLQVGRVEGDAGYYCVMELADPREGDREDIAPKTYAPRTLQDDIDAHGALTLSDTLNHARRLAEALAHLHAAGLVHRDLKPANIIFVKGAPKLADIGLVAPLNSSRSVMGTHGYIPREGLGQPPADVYAMGKVLYEMITGHDRHAFPSPPPALRDPACPPELHALNTLILQACDPDPATRPTAEDFAQILEAILQGQIQTPHRNPVLAWVAGLGIVLLVLWVGFGKPSSQPATLPQVDLEAGLICRFDFNGNTRDQSPYRNHAEARGEITFGPGRKGKLGQACIFDGNQTHLIVAPSKSLETLTNLTITAWINIADVSRSLEQEDFGGLVDRIPEPGFAFFRLWNDQLDFGSNTPYHQIKHLHALQRGEWHHVAAVYNGETKLLYLDGIEIERENVGPGKLAWGSSGLRIGHEAAGSFVGAMDSLRIYNRGLTGVEIKILSH